MTGPNWRATRSGRGYDLVGGGGFGEDVKLQNSILKLAFFFICIFGNQSLWRKCHKISLITFSTKIISETERYEKSKWFHKPFRKCYMGGG